MSAPAWTRQLRVVLAALVCALGWKGAAQAQCDPQWLPGDGLPGVNGTVYATTVWDPDGPGPLTALVVVGGSFTLAGDVSVTNIATCDLATGQWAALGSGTSAAVRALTTMPNGDLVVGGNFTTAGGVVVNSIARWDGVAWGALDSGMSGGASGPYVYALSTLANGDLVAAGDFTSAGGVGATRIARWDGTSWSALDSGIGGTVLALSTLPTGDLVAGGSFTTAGGVAANFIARWDGITWSTLGSGTNATVRALTILPTGDLVAGGHFTFAGGVAAGRIARWNGAAWSALG